eukprot:sb/3479622/
MHRVGEVLRRKHGSDWRSKVSQSFSLPSCPEFILPGTSSIQESTPAPSPAPAPAPAPQEEKPIVQPTKTEVKSPKVEKPAAKPTTKPTTKKPAPTEKPVDPVVKPVEVDEIKIETAPSPKPKADLSTEGVVLSKPNRMPTREEQYQKFKEQGNKHVGAQEYKKALNCYAKCITLCPKLTPAQLNSALCHLKLGDNKKAISCADKVLDVEPKNIKALYRRASAYKALKDYPTALKDLKLTLELDSENKAAKQLMDEVKKLWGVQLRGMHGSTKPAPKPAPPKKQGKKIQIVQESSDSESSDSESSEEEVPVKRPAQPARKQPAPAKKPETPKKQPEPVKKQSEPVKKQSEPVKKQSEPVKKQSEPVKKQSEPVKKQSEPVKKQSEPVKKQSEPVKKQPEPVKKQSEPVKKQSEPVKKQPAPAAKKEPETVKKEPETVKPAPAKKDKPWLKRQEQGSAASDKPTEAPTSFSFLQHWNEYKKKKDESGFAKLLESCDSATLGRLFSTPMLEADMVMGICGAISLHFIPNKLDAKAVEVLTALSKAPRFDVITMLLSSKDKKSIHTMISKLNYDASVLEKLGKTF